MTTNDDTSRILPAPPMAAAPPAGPLALDTVVARLGHVEWVEAVAIGEAVCRVVSASGGAPVPQLADVSIASDGSVVVRPAPPGETAGPRLARLLHALTSSGSVPVRFRLFVTKWIAYGEAHSIADVAGELAYFARPDGAALIQAVYERALETPAAGPRPVPPPAPVAPPATRTAPRRRRPFARMAIGAAACAAVAVVAAAVWSGGRLPSEPPASVMSVVDGLTAWFAPASGEAADSDTSSSTPDRAAPSGRVAGGVAVSRAEPMTHPSDERTEALAPQFPEIVLPDLSASLASGPDVPRSPAVLESETRLGAGERRVEPTASLATAIYSSADADVVPPQIRQPQLPPALHQGAAAGVNTMELVVSASGEVERVRLLSPPRRMADMMMLSGAKAWVFEPASRHGEAVRYRLFLSWQTTP